MLLGWLPSFGIIGKRRGGGGKDREGEGRRGGEEEEEMVGVRAVQKGGPFNPAR